MVVVVVMLKKKPLWILKGAPDKYINQQMKENALEKHERECE
jgi:hypothetical protein